jgi:hypothetical protein
VPRSSRQRVARDERSIAYLHPPTRAAALPRGTLEPMTWSRS